VRSPLIFALVFALLHPSGAVGQKKQEPHVKIICPRVRLKLVLQVRQKYPEEAKKAGIEGKVSLRCIVGPDGSIGEIGVLAGEEPFVQAAKTAVSQWRYEPLLLNGVAVKSETTVDVIFQIPKKE
jgi:TonB family protein